MCGFIGEINFNKPHQENIYKANELLNHRGPDSQLVGYLNDKNNFEVNNRFNTHSLINLAFSRLSILDLSNFANQPFLSEDRKYALLFNGEIFNFKEIKNELQTLGVNFKSDKSDTEVVLKSLITWGSQAISKFNGQFSIVFIDLDNNEITLVRDRLGQKPLFYYFDSKKIFFGSTLDSIITLLNTKNLSICKKSFTEFLNLGVVTSPNTIIENISKVEPGNFIKFKFENEIQLLDKKRYWSPITFIDNKPFDYITFHNKLTNSVLRRTISDVPIATFLSGGIDSTSIAKKLHENSINLNTFSISIQDHEMDESYWSNHVAKILQSNHEVKLISAKNNFQEIINIIKSLDEPFGDSSYIPSYIMAQTISKKYKVALSGDGGDELLMGYIRHKNIFNSIKQIPILEKIFSLIYYFYPSFLGTGKIINNYFASHQKKHNNFFQDLKFLSLLGYKNDKNFNEKYDNKNFTSVKEVQIKEYNYYLSELMLYKIDRSSMANSVEIRSPFVDHELIEYVLSTDSADFFDVNNQKKILKDDLISLFGNKFVNRKKQGFSFPIYEFIYIENKKNIYDILMKSNLYNKKTVSLLFLIKNKANAKRLWKMLVLTIWVKNKIEN